MKDELTIIIKTFERKKELWNLLKSIRKMNMKYKVLVADDSKDNYKDETIKKFSDLNLEYFVLPFDQGLAYGRNFLMEKVETDYFLLCDDDFEFDERVKIEESLEIFKKEKLDILGGYVRNYLPIKRNFDYFLRYIEKILKIEFKRNFIGDIIIDSNKIKINYVTRKFPEYTKTDICSNFFIGRKDSIKRIGGWNNKLKLNEHTDFFIKCKKGNLNIAFTNKLAVKHFPNKKGYYFEFRKRNFVSNLLDIHDVQRIEFLYDRKKNSYIMEYGENGEIVKR